MFRPPSPRRCPPAVRHVVHSKNGDVISRSIADVVPTDGPHFAVGAAQIFHRAADRVREADVFECKHVVDEPELRQRLADIRSLVGRTRFVCCWRQIDLRRGGSCDSSRIQLAAGL